MTGINTYSTTASENVQANTGINWDEGMPPGSVNNSARQNMADTRSQWNNAQWFQYGIGSKTVAATYASSTSITLSGGDATTAWHANRRVKATGSTTGTIYGKVSSSSYNSGTTTTTVNFTWDSGSLSNETLTVYLSIEEVTGKGTPPEGIGGGTIGSALAIADNNFTLQDNGDATKQAQFQLSGITTGNTRTLTVPDASDTIAVLGTNQTFTGTQTFSGQIIGKGTATNDSASAGYIGEFISQNTASGSAVSLTTNVAADVASISLTAGDWDVSGTLLYTTGSSTTVTEAIGWISTTSATVPTPPNSGAYFDTIGFTQTGTASRVSGGPVGTTRITVSGTTTVYLSTRSTFSTSTMAAYGYIRARRMR